jgi:hypothetical protein
MLALKSNWLKAVRFGMKNMPLRQECHLLQLVINSKQERITIEAFVKIWGLLYMEKTLAFSLRP